ncbi:rRNA methyltransferase 1, mitochondrial [Ananas comosus]|uniref:rRNA methyltransferase 1, mitochondrial n=1 Tax=Ananas comosus TaxID=4615 RepID=A0A199VYV4_ANACO|nr:rRNA methyltransferase 1, mitochondrial [Ananas comosus]
MPYCNLAKAPALPLLSRVPSSPRFSILPPRPLPRPFPTSLFPATPKSTIVVAAGSSSLSKARILSRGGSSASSAHVVNRVVRSFSRSSDLRSMHSTRARVFFSGVSGEVASEDYRNERAGKVLPWIASNGERRRRDKVAMNSSAVRSNSSSWERSAEKFFARNGGNVGRENLDQIDRSRTELEDWRSAKEEQIEEEEYEEDVEPIDNPKWYKIKERYKGFADRDSRFEKPEVQQWSKQENWGRKTWKEANESTVPKIVGQGVYGVGPVLAALMAGRREFYALYVQEGLDLSGNNKKKKDKKGVEKVLKMAEKIGLKVIEASKHDLNMAVDSRPHQGLILDASPLEMVIIRELEPTLIEGQRAPVWVALDEVTDPQNLGAIIRSAYFFGAEGVVLCAKNSAPLSGVVSKASAGSLELIELRSCKNMMQFLSNSIENGWRVLGGSVSPKALPLTEVGGAMPTILVLGSEGTGLRPLVERTCTQLVRIAGNTDRYIEGTGTDVEEGNLSILGQDVKSFLAVESLNVSVAAGVLLYHLVGSNTPSCK